MLLNGYFDSPCGILQAPGQSLGGCESAWKEHPNWEGNSFHLRLCAGSVIYVEAERKRKGLSGGKKDGKGAEAAIRKCEGPPRLPFPLLRVDGFPSALCPQPFPQSPIQRRPALSVVLATLHQKFTIDLLGHCSCPNHAQMINQACQDLFHNQSRHIPLSWRIVAMKVFARLPDSGIWPTI